MESSFGETLRARRNELRLSQEQVVKSVATIASARFGNKLTLHQSVYSQWERSIQQPTPTDPLVAALEEALKFKDGFLVSILNRKRQQAAIEVDRLTEAFQESQEFISQIGPEHLKIWIMGTSALAATEPGQRGQLAREAWEDNLRRGVQFRFVWFLDALDTVTFRQLAAAMIQVSKSIKESGSLPKNLGKFIHYATRLHAKPTRTDGACERFKLNRKLYEDFLAEAASYPETLVCHKLVEYDRITKEQGDVIHDLQPFWLGFGSVVLYAPDTFREIPRASLVLREMAPSLRSSTSQPFILWLPTRYAMQLHTVIKQFEEEYDSALKD